MGQSRRSFSPELKQETVELCRRTAARPNEATCPRARARRANGPLFAPHVGWAMGDG